MVYKVLAATREDMNEGWVWLTNAGLESRSIVKIGNTKNDKVIYCECLEIDDNFINEYNKPRRISINHNEPTLVINAWYRKRLGGIKTKSSHDLEITSANNLWGKLRSNTGHPQVIVRMATWLALLSVGLGILGVCISFK